jgi:hypothetical protein
VWNVDNRVPRMVFKQGDAASWSYVGAGAWRMANASAANRVEVVLGLDDGWADIGLNSLASVNACQASLGVGLDDAVNAPNIASTSAIVPHAYTAAASSMRVGMVARTWARPGIGYHFYQWMEMSNSGSVTFYGQNTNGNFGFNGVVLG